MAFREELKKELENPEFARHFGAAQAKSSLALTLHDARNRAGLTQKELADRVGVTQEYIAKLESGEANPTIGRVGELLSAMRFTLSTGFRLFPPDEEKRREEQGKRWWEAMKDPLFVRDIAELNGEYRPKKKKTK